VCCAVSAIWCTDNAELEPECVGELTEVRRSMMEDYRVNPLLVRDCSHEIKYCGGMKSQFDERTMHCLMDLARPQHGKDIGNKIRSSSTCTRTVSVLFIFLYFSYCIISCLHGNDADNEQSLNRLKYIICVALRSVFFNLFVFQLILCKLVFKLWHAEEIYNI